MTKRQQLIINRTLRILRSIPWIRAVALTGSVATGEASNQDDIDWLIITAPRRLWLTRLVLFLLVGVFGSLWGLRLRRVGEKEIAGRLCFNLWLAEDALLVPPAKQTPFAAGQIYAARLLLNRQKTWEKFLAINASWLGPKNQRKGRCKFSQIKPSSCLVLDLLNQFCFWLQFQILKRHQTKEIVNLSQAFFHPQKR